MHRLRDSMGHTLEPLTGLMMYVSLSSILYSCAHHTSYVIAFCNGFCDLRIRPTPLYSRSEYIDSTRNRELTPGGHRRYSPLPYAALPHLLTLFAHAAPTLPLIQHIFDYILVRPPLIIVYIVAAVSTCLSAYSCSHPKTLCLGNPITQGSSP